VGFEPTPFRNGALSHRLRPLGQSVLVGSTVGLLAAAHNASCLNCAIRSVMQEQTLQHIGRECHRDDLGMLIQPAL
jgi:hypothetical protein